MGLFDLFKKRAKAAPEQPAPPLEEVESYSGMRVEVTAPDGRLLFVAKLVGPRGSTAQLYQYSETELPQQEEPIPVRIRGYHDGDRKAVYLEGAITPLPHRVWQVENLIVAKTGNDRAFFRLDTNLNATATTFGGLGAGEAPCKLLNISVGGARISSERPYREGDKFLLKVKLLEDRDVSAIFCQVLRVIEKESTANEYGCRFIELNEADQERITQNIFAVQRQKRNAR